MKMSIVRTKRARARIIALLLWVGLPGPHVYGQAIIAPAGRTVFHGESLIRSFTEIENLSTRTANGQSIELTQYVAPLAPVYGFLPNWEVIAVQPYVVADITSRTALGTVSQSLNGLADSQFFVQYDGFYKRNSPGGFRNFSQYLLSRRVARLRRFLSP
jgi:hypothetical protein